MNTSERNSRILIVFPIIGSLIYVSKFIFRFTKSVFSQLYDQYGIGVDHLFAIALVASWVLVFCLAIIYCYFESHTFSNYTDGREILFKEKSDKSYQKLVNSFFLSLLIIFSLILTVSLIQSIVVLGYLILSFILLIILTYFITWIFRSKSVKIASIYGKFEQLKKTIFFNIALLWILSYVCVFLITVFLGLNSNINSTLSVEFSGLKKQSVEIKLEYLDSTMDKMPDEFRLYIENSKRNEWITLAKEEFTLSFVEAIVKKKNKLIFHETEIKKHSLASSKIKLKKKIDLAGFLEEGINTIVINFTVNNIVNDESTIEYRIVNRLVVTGNNVEINENHFDIEI